MKHVGVPVKNEKNGFPTIVLTFLGLEIDTVTMEMRLPRDKFIKLRERIATARQKRKLTLQELQSIIGLLNFACAVVVPGRTFLRRLIDLTIGLKKPHHKRYLNQEAKADLDVWSIFISHFNGRALFLQEKWQTSETLHLFTDASGLGFGGNIWKQMVCKSMDR